MNYSLLKRTYNILSYHFKKLEDENYHVYTETRSCMLDIEKELQEQEKTNKHDNSNTD